MPRIEFDALSLILEHNPKGFRALCDALPHFVWTADPDGTATYVNDRFRTYAGTGGEPPERSFFSAIHPDDAANVQAVWQRARAAAEVFETTLRIRRAEDQIYRWFLARAVPLRSNHGVVRGWIGTSTDIDRQMRANENLNFVLDASNAFSAARRAEDVAKDFARLAVRKFADWAIVVLREGDSYDLTAVEHRDPARASEVRKFAERYAFAAEGSEFMARVKNRETLLVPEITDDMLVKSAKDDEHLALMRSMQMRSALMTHLVSDDGVLGSVIMYTTGESRPFSSADLDVLVLLSERAATAIGRLRAITQEQRVRRRMQFVGRASTLLYESLDPAATFSELTQLLTGSFADFAAALRVEPGGVVRVIATSHRDPRKRALVEAFLGVRAFNPEAEKSFIASIAAHKTIALDALQPEQIAKTTWPYLAGQLRDLGARAAVTVPLHSRGRTYGAIVAYLDSREAFAPEEIEVLAEIGKHASIAMENADVFERERHIAETLQDSLLPPSLPDVEGLAFDAVYIPASSDTQVGGDWYDAFVLEDGTIVVSTGDAMGRGLYAAVIMGKVRHLLAIATSYERDPARILDTVESVLARRYPDAIVTAYLGLIDPQHEKMVYATAGHPPAMLRRDSEVRELQGEGLPLGLRRLQPPARSETADLRGARMLVFYTDGLTEAGHDVLEGTKRLEEVLLSQAVLHTRRPALFIEASCLPKRAEDDVAVLAISFDPSVRWSFDAESAQAAQDARGEFVRYLRDNTADAAGVAAAELVFGELVGNVVRHAPGPIDVDVEWSSDYPELHVIDRGAQFRLSDRLPEDALAEGGRGLFIVRELSRDLSVEHIAGYGNHVTAELPIRRR